MKMIAALVAAAAVVALGTLVDDALGNAPDTTEHPFLAENDSAMSRMMSDMTIKPTGDVSRDFVAMMVPHHQGAVDMAMAYLRFGHNEKLRRLAQEIIVTQQEEIAAMRLAVGERPPLPAAAPTQIAPSGTNMKM